MGRRDHQVRTLALPGACLPVVATPIMARVIVRREAGGVTRHRDHWVRAQCEEGNTACVRCGSKVARGDSL